MSKQWGSKANAARSGAPSGGRGFGASARRSADRVSTRGSWGFGKPKTPQTIARQSLFGKKAK